MTGELRVSRRGVENLQASQQVARFRAWRRMVVAAVIGVLLGSWSAWLGGTSVSANDLAELVLGQPVEAVLTDNEQHSYPLTLAAGQYVEALIEQQGVDVAVTLQAPDGKALAQFDADSRPRGKETAAHIVNAADGRNGLLQGNNHLLEYL